MKQPTLENLIASGVNRLGLPMAPVVWGLATAGWKSLDDYDLFLQLISKSE